MNKKIWLLVMLVIGMVDTIEASERRSVFWSATKHIGDRPHQEDYSAVEEFSIDGRHYHLAMVCDGHGGYQASKYTTDRLGAIINDRLKDGSNDVKQVLLDSFAECERGIIQKQSDQNITQPGTTVVLSLLDFSQNKRYVANLGDSRCYLLHNNENQYEEIWKTIDHDVKNENEKEYVESHGGQIIRAADLCYRVFRAVDPKKVSGLETTRAFGDAHLKGTTNSDGTVGPVNPVPEIYEDDIPSDCLELLVSDGFTKKADDDDYVQLSDCWTDIFKLSSNDFYEKYKFTVNPLQGGAKCKYTSPIVTDEDCEGNNEDLTEINKRLMYLMRHIGTQYIGLDNMAFVLRKVGSIGSLKVNRENKKNTTTTTTTTTATTTTIATTSTAAVEAKTTIAAKTATTKKESTASPSTNQKETAITNNTFNRYSCVALIALVACCFAYWRLWK